MAHLDITAKFPFSQEDAKTKIIDALNEASKDQPLTITWVRDMAAQVHGNAVSGGIVITQTTVQIAIDVPWYLSGIKGIIDRHIVDALKARGFTV